MGCVPCGAKRSGKKISYLWSSDPDPVTGLVTEVTKKTEIEAMGLVARHGGSFELVLT